MTEVLASFDPALAEQLVASPAERFRRFHGVPAHLRARADLGWALVVDDAFFRDPVTSYGIADALLDAAALASALARGEGPAAYVREREDPALLMFEITQRIACLDWRLDTLPALHAPLNVCMRGAQRLHEGGSTSV